MNIPSTTHQGVYRGLQDTRTPFYATLASSVLNVILNPILIFGCGLGVKGAAIGTVVAQVSASAAQAAVRGQLYLCIAAECAIGKVGDRVC